MGDELFVDPGSSPSLVQSGQATATESYGVAAKSHPRNSDVTDDASHPSVIPPKDRTEELDVWNPFGEEPPPPPPVKPSPSELEKDPPTKESDSNDWNPFEDGSFEAERLDSSNQNLFGKGLFREEPPLPEPPPSKSPGKKRIQLTKFGSGIRKAKNSPDVIPTSSPSPPPGATPTSSKSPPPPHPPPQSPSRAKLHPLLSFSPEKGIVIEPLPPGTTPSFEVLKKSVCEPLAQLCFPEVQLEGSDVRIRQLNADNVRILQSVLVQMAAENPRAAVFCDPSVMQGMLDTSAIPRWNDLYSQMTSLMVSLPAVEIFVPQALKVLEALSEAPQGGEPPDPGQQCEVNLPKLLEILQQSGLGDTGMQILTELFTPHFQVNDPKCTCHALVNYELMTNPTRLACVLVNTTTSSAIRFKPLRCPSSLLCDLPGRGVPPRRDAPPRGSYVEGLVCRLYQREEEGGHQATVGRDPAKILKTYLGILDESATLPSRSYPFTVRVDDSSQGVVYTLPLDTRSLLEERNTSIVAFHCLAPDDFGNLSCPGHACLALKTQEGDVVFHTNYQDTGEDGRTSVFYVGITREGVLSKFSLGPDGSFIVGEPYMLSTHTSQSERANGLLSCLEDARFFQDNSNPFWAEKRRQFFQCKDPRLTEVQKLITQCVSDPAKISEIFAILQPTLEILSPSELPPPA
jgi:hypothetical protein